MNSSKNPEPRQQAGNTLERLLDEREVSEVTGRSLSSLRRDRLLGTGIAFVKCGALVRYHPQDVREYIERNRHNTEGR